MARVKRWFPVSQDINGDPEIWAMTDEYGDRSLRLWLEILCILDRTENHWKLSGDWLATLSRRCRHSVAKVRRLLGHAVATGWLRGGGAVVNGWPEFFEAPNYAKYHRSQVHKGDDKCPPPSEPSEPSEPNLKKEPPIVPLTGGPDSLPGIAAGSHAHTNGNGKEPEAARKRRSEPIPTAGPWPSVEAFVALYNDQSPDEWRRAETASENRAKKIRKALTAFPDESWWREVYELAGRSRFLRSRVPGRNGGRPFIADLDWLLANHATGTENAVRIMDGQYVDGD